MHLTSFADVVRNILAEPLPTDKHPILSLAKTDQQKQLAREKELEHSNESATSGHSDAARRRWLREAYKVPLAAAGVRKIHSCLVTKQTPQKATKEEVECEYARERRLRSQATRGVVALFNAVRQHQSELNAQLDRGDVLETQKERILTQMTTSDFLDRLSAGLPKSKSEDMPPKSSSVPQPDEKASNSTSDFTEPPKKKRRLRTTFGVKVVKKPGT